MVLAAAGSTSSALIVRRAMGLLILYFITINAFHGNIHDIYSLGRTSRHHFNLLRTRYKILGLFT
jgi:hypothetical protein